MKQRQFGANGPMVSEIGFGAMSLGGIFGDTTEAQSLACLDAMLDVGIDFIDTANIYGMGISETVLGKWLASRKPQLVLATKASYASGPPRHIDNSETHLRHELEASLRRLGRDHVELFYIHRREHSRPLDEVIGTLSRMIEEGRSAVMACPRLRPIRCGRRMPSIPVGPCKTNTACGPANPNWA